jgi:hypothetical protein
MKRIIIGVFMVLILSGVSSGTEKSLDFGGFGKIALYYQSG